MKKFLVITKIPPRQGFVGTIPEKIVVDENEIEDSEELVVDGFHVPLGGTVYIIPMEHVTTLKSRIVTEVT